MVMQSVLPSVNKLSSAAADCIRNCRDYWNLYPSAQSMKGASVIARAASLWGFFMQLSSRTLLHAMLLLVVLFAVVGCSTTPPNVYKEEKFDSTNIYSRRFEVSSTVACEAVRRTLLSQGYVIGAVTANQINGTKSFQPRSDAHVQIAFRVVCTDDDAKGDKSSIYVTALEDRYALKKVNNVASLGVGVLGSVSVPFSASDDSLVKVASETIAAEGFYSRFFDVVERFLGSDTDPEEVSTDPVPATAAVPVAAAPAKPVAEVPTAPAAPTVAATPTTAPAVPTMPVTPVTRTHTTTEPANVP
jgi:hypothetical protein